MSNPILDPFQYVQQWRGRYSEGGWWHSFDLPDGRQIQGVCDIQGLRDRIGRFPIPQDLRGKRVLDIGCWDGWFSFEMERRGAEVLAVDCWDNPRFHEIHALLDSKVDYRQFDVYELTPARIGRFDIVLFMGVLYHLKHPLLALELVCALTTDFAAVDSFVLTDNHFPGAGSDTRPLLEFYETTEFGGQSDNWSGPNIPCLLAMCRTAGFARADLVAQLSFSACVACYRHWEPSITQAPPPVLTTATHNTNYGINFQSRYDDYVNIWFETPAEQLTLDQVKPQVGGYGVRPIILNRESSPGHWQATFKMPALPAPGWYDVCVRILDGPESNPLRLALDMTHTGFPISLAGVRDARTYEPNVTSGDVVSLWVLGLPAHADLATVKVVFAGRTLKTMYVDVFQSVGEARQINAQLPSAAAGLHGHIHVAYGDQRTAAEPLSCQPT